MTNELTTELTNNKGFLNTLLTNVDGEQCLITEKPTDIKDSKGETLVRPEDQDVPLEWVYDAVGADEKTGEKIKKYAVACLIGVGMFIAFLIPYNVTRKSVVKKIKSENTPKGKGVSQDKLENMNK